MDFKILDVRQDIKILSMFLIVQFLGLLIATQVYASTPLVVIQQSSVNSQVGTSLTTAVGYIAMIAAFAVLIVLFIRRFKGRRAFIIFEAVVILYTTFILFLIVIAILLNLAGLPYLLTPIEQYLLAFLFAALLVIAKNKEQRLRNTAAMLSAMGIGLVIGIYLNFLTVFIFMIILAVYDFIAVFITKHMVAMGQAMASMNLAFLIGVSDVEGVPQSQLQGKEILMAKNHRQLLRSYPNALRQLDQRRLAPIIGQRLLGNGDLAVPLMVSVSAYKLLQNFTASIVVTIGAAFGLLLTFYILSRYRRPLPAIPPLLFGITMALLVYFLIIGVI